MSSVGVGSVPGVDGLGGEMDRSEEERGQEIPLPGDWISKLGGAIDFVRRRIAGDYEVDPESGFDPELNHAVLMPAARRLYRGWFKIRMRGLEHLPSVGPALVVANHSGVLPIDAMMLQVGVLDEHP